MTHENQEQEMTFWDHLDELRKVIFRIVIAVSLLAVVAFINKTLLFDIILPPTAPISSPTGLFVPWGHICRCLPSVRVSFM